MNLTRPDNGEALERLTEKFKELDHDEVGAYFLLCMAFLARNAPDVCVFVMDHADRRLAEADEAIAAEPASTPSTESAWIDRQGDVWTLGTDGLMHTSETRPFPREHVEKKWGPLRPIPPAQTPGGAA